MLHLLHIQTSVIDTLDKREEHKLKPTNFKPETFFRHQTLRSYQASGFYDEDFTPELTLLHTNLKAFKNYLFKICKSMKKACFVNNDNAAFFNTPGRDPKLTFSTDMKSSTFKILSAGT